MRSVVNESGLNVGSGKFAIKFWAPWCGPCKLIEKTIKLLFLEDEYSEVEFLSVDIDQVPALAKKFKIKTIPTVLLLDDGVEFDRLIGLHTLNSMKKEFDKFLGKEEKTLLSGVVENIPAEIEETEELAQVMSG